MERITITHKGKPYTFVRMSGRVLRVETYNGRSLLAGSRIIKELQKIFPELFNQERKRGLE